ncbi:MAG: helix-turn-helix domain-containing protein [Eggerthellaceae bacterium]|nr:helix-turn-helix domain-containing protein [Eggerthellaceae bacterium]
MTEQTHYKHSTKRLPVPVKEYYSAHEVACLLQISKDKVYDLARLPGDPLPLRVLRGHARGSLIHRDDLREWMERNSVLFAERIGR